MLARKLRRSTSAKETTNGEAGSVPGERDVDDGAGVHRICHVDCEGVCNHRERQYQHLIDYHHHSHKLARPRACLSKKRTLKSSGRESIPSTRERVRNITTRTIWKASYKYNRIPSQVSNQHEQSRNTTQCLKEYASSIERFIKERVMRTRPRQGKCIQVHDKGGKQEPRCKHYCRQNR